jgi:hypothetical protein
MGCRNFSFGGGRPSRNGRAALLAWAQPYGRSKLLLNRRVTRWDARPYFAHYGRNRCAAGGERRPVRQGVRIGVLTDMSGRIEISVRLLQAASGLLIFAIFAPEPRSDQILPRAPRLTAAYHPDLSIKDAPGWQPFRDGAL